MRVAEGVILLLLIPLEIAMIINGKLFEVTTVVKKISNTIYPFYF